jgi:hypothetical protein
MIERFPSEEEFGRQDSDAYCPRRDEQVLILDGTCYCKNRDLACSGCVFDSEPIRLKLIWLMSEILQARSQNGCTPSTRRDLKSRCMPE